jgi:hypothetical protein
MQDGRGRAKDAQWDKGSEVSSAEGSAQCRRGAGHICGKKSAMTGAELSLPKPRHLHPTIDESKRRASTATTRVPEHAHLDFPDSTDDCSSISKRLYPQDLGGNAVMSRKSIRFSIGARRRSSVVSVSTLDRTLSSSTFAQKLCLINMIGLL